MHVKKPKAAHEDDEQAMTAICSCLRNDRTRQEAFLSLLEIARKEDERLIDAVGSVIDGYGTYSQWRIYFSSSIGFRGKSLSKVADTKNERLIKVVSTRLKLPSQDGRFAAVEALSQIASRGNDCAISEICSLLHRRLGVRQSALEALSRLAKRGDERAVAAVTARTRDRSKAVQVVAGAILQKLQRGVANNVATPATKVARNMCHVLWPACFLEKCVDSR